MPDDRGILLGQERFECPEALFRPELLGRDQPGIHEAIYHAIHKCAVELRPVRSPHLAHHPLIHSFFLLSSYSLILLISSSQLPLSLLVPLSSPPLLFPLPVASSLLSPLLLSFTPHTIPSSKMFRFCILTSTSAVAALSSRAFATDSTMSCSGWTGLQPFEYLHSPHPNAHRLICFVLIRLFSRNADRFAQVHDPPDRLHSVWHGGSILSANSAFTTTMDAWFDSDSFLPCDYHC